MSFTRFLPAIAFILISAGLWALGIVLIPTGERGAYAALVCGKDVPDREIRERLEKNGITGIVSESGQRVLLDCFGNVELVPLDEYPSRVLPFDPRNDGYAEKLHSLFVQDDRRFIYIPLGSPAASGLAGIEKRLAAALEDIPYSLQVAASWPAGLFLALFGLAAAAFFIVPPLRWALRPHAACLIPLLPALAPLALGGVAGFALASLLAGCAALLAGPCLERFTLPRRWGTPPIVCWLLPPFLLICYIILAAFSGLPPVFTLLVLAFFCGIMVFRLRAAYRAAVSNAGDGLFFNWRNAEHRSFSPVPILSRRSFTFAFSWAMLPFAAVALVLACADIAISLTNTPDFSALPSGGSVTEADYYAHYRFQSTFSTRSLNDLDHGGMMAYDLDSDGLLVGISGGFSNNAVDAEFSPANIPPFPLGDLVRYLEAPRRGRGILALLSVLLPLFFIFPILFHGRIAGVQERGYLLIKKAYSGIL